MKRSTISKTQSLKASRYLILVLMVGCFLTSCDDDGSPQPKPPSDSINKIMPLGASRVEGNRPEFESYRYELWKLLVDGGWTFDYIGTRTDEATYDGFPNLAFDNDHEGRGGWKSGQILEGISDWIDQAGVPDIVLFSSPGGNDALTNQSYEDAIANINAIIDILQAANPKVTIIIEQLAPGRSDLMTGALKTYFDNLQQEALNIAAQQSTDDSRVITIDMSTGFMDSFLADDVHYNEEGARFIAKRYFDVLKDVLEQ